MNNMKITVVGTGYVGLALATLLSQDNEVVALDVNKEKVDLINERISPIKDKEIQKFFKSKKLNLLATCDKEKAYKNSKFVFIATPTNYDEKKNYFDTSSVDSVIKESIKFNPKATIVIKSTIPVGYTEEIKKKVKFNNIIFSPEFLREGKALYDNLHPSRIVVGSKDKNAKELGKLLKNHSLDKDTEIIYTNSTEAEAIKLFSNTYLALRVSYFNELDTYASMKGLNSSEIIKGISLDPRIGDFYNNPSFGYGGYCLPKDTKQLLANFKGVPQNVIKAIVESNKTRKQYIVDEIVKKKPKVVGVYRLAMKSDSDNYRASAIIDVIKGIKKKNIKVIIYDPSIKDNKLFDCEIVKELKEFKKESNIILANRFNSELNDSINKVYTKDLYKRD